jgi:hypothetical protein
MPWRSVVRIVGVILLVGLGLYLAIIGSPIGSLGAFLAAVVWPWLASTTVTFSIEDDPREDGGEG